MSKSMLLYGMNTLRKLSSVIARVSEMFLPFPFSRFLHLPCSEMPIDSQQSLSCKIILHIQIVSDAKKTVGICFRKNKVMTTFLEFAAQKNHSRMLTCE